MISKFIIKLDCDGPELEYDFKNYLDELLNNFVMSYYKDCPITLTVECEGEDEEVWKFENAAD